MRLYHWAAILVTGALVSASAWAVPGLLRTDSNDGQAKTDAQPTPIRESQARQAPSAAPAAPQRTEATKYDNWVVVCREASGETKKRCSATLRLTAQGRGKMLLVWQFDVDKDGRLVTAFRVANALGVKSGGKTLVRPLLIQNGVELKFGNGRARRINYVWCGPKQCFAEAPIDDAFVKEAVANTEATITIRTAGGQAIPLKIPIKGIDKAISATRK